MIPFLFLGIIGGAFTKLGFSWYQAVLILFVTLVGSLVNIPVTTVENKGTIVMDRPAPGGMYGRFYNVPESVPSFTTTVAVNVGGCLVPVFVSVYLMYRMMAFPGGFSVLISALIGVCVVTIVTHRAARPVRGLGIATPFFIAPACALICGIVLSWGIPVAAPVIAYVSGTLGTLIGADLLNLKRLGELGAPVASIGGAGTFDGVFLSGIIAALLA